MGLRKKHTTEIDGLRYETTTLPATNGLTIFPKFLAIFGQAAIEFALKMRESQMDFSKESLELLFENAEVISIAMGKVAHKAAENDSLLVVKDLLESTRCLDGKVGDNAVEVSLAGSHFDEHFAGRYMHLMRVVIWVFKVNFIAP